ncbi:unnamed protein product, partial [Ixodes pacificus]
TVAAAAVRLPPYWDRDPRVWLLQAESQFHLAGVTTQGRKYHHVVSALSPAAADEVYDVLANPAAATPYDQLKNALLQRTDVSERSRVQQLLSAEDLGDRRPSQLLRRMTQFLGERANNLDDVFLPRAVLAKATFQCSDGFGNSNNVGPHRTCRAGRRHRRRSYTRPRPPPS